MLELICFTSFYVKAVQFEDGRMWFTPVKPSMRKVSNLRYVLLVRLSEMFPS